MSGSFPGGGQVDNYQVIGRLGAGAFGQVFKGENRNTGEIVAIKIINLEEAEDEIETIRQEIAVLAQCQSAFVTKYIESFVHGSDLWIVMEYMAGGSIAGTTSRKTLCALRHPVFTASCFHAQA